MILGIPKRILLIIAVVGGVAVIYFLGAGNQASEGADGPTGCKMSVTADVLNVRAEPADSAEIVGKYKQNAEADAHPVVQNGFRKLGDNRWAAAEFLTPLQGARCG